MEEDAPPELQGTFSHITVHLCHSQTLWKGLTSRVRRELHQCDGSHLCRRMKCADSKLACFNVKRLIFERRVENGAKKKKWKGGQITHSLELQIIQSMLGMQSLKLMQPSVMNLSGNGSSCHKEGSSGFSNDGG